MEINRIKNKVFQFLLGLVFIPYSSGFTIEADIGAAIIPNDELTTYYNSLTGLYAINDKYYLGVKLSHVYSEAFNNVDSDVYARIEHAFSDKTSAYLDLGASTINNGVLLGAGFIYNVNPNFGVKFGYQMFPNNNYSDTYLYGFGLHYSGIVIRNKYPSDVTNRPSTNAGLATNSRIETSEKTKDKIVASSISDCSLTHTVETGEWPSKIARKNQQSLEELYKNNLWLKERFRSANAIIYPGEEIKIVKSDCIQKPKDP
ncbi:LysM domain-containing protein [Vibrio sp. CyArs1]|uniref:LysM peptidoglycan-binding domain-containing protein n=1 Tax=Vibrio sp. CyArs1 TaxID=2682577 RepID=UPI001F064085|nr:LysM domain-containing protein [Vibrio sp. CyArs1]